MVDPRPCVELTINWSPCNVQRVLALVDTGAESTLLYGNLGKFLGPTDTIENYGGRIIRRWMTGPYDSGYWQIAS